MFLLVGLFAAGALLIMIASLFRHTKVRSINEPVYIFASEILIISAVLLPAWAGGFYFLLALLLFLFQAHREIASSAGVTGYVVLSSSFIFCSLLLVGMYMGYLNIHETQIIYILAAIIIVLVAGITKPHRIKATGLLLITCTAASCLLFIASLPDGFMQLLLLYIITETNDSFAYLAGKLFGKRRLFPVISPHKTLEGMTGGIVAALLAGGLFNHFILHNPWNYQLTVMGACIAGAIAGDLVFSAYKRSAGIKDFSNVIKNQGGILDIYDSLLLASIVYYFLLL